jgi:3-oxoacyl-[acyl-carrier protein] reductase
MDLKLEGKRALVTGGSRGIGRAVVLGLAREGVSVAACYQRESDDVARLRGELEQLGGPGYLVAADVGDPASVHDLVTGAHERFGGLDILVNNAGVVSHRMLADLDEEEWHRIIEVNLSGIFRVTKAALPLLGPGSSIVNITSGVALRGMPGRTHYASSKAGVIGFTRALCKEIGGQGIRVNALAPGIIETDQVSGLTPEARVRYSGLAALGRLGQPDEIADAVMFLASDLSRYISGVTLHVDGGI